MLTRILRYIRNTAFAKKTEAISRKLILPGFENLPVYYVAKFFVRGLNESSLSMRAAYLAFNFFLALFPAMIFLFSLIPFIPIENFQEELLLQLKLFVPRTAYSLIQTTVIDILSRPRGGLLSFGFIFTLYFAINLIDAMISVFNKSYHIAEKRSYFEQKLISLLLIFLLSIMLLIGTTLIILSKPMLNFIVGEQLIDSTFSHVFFAISKWIVLMAVIYFSIFLLYYFGPARKGKFRFFSAGASLATLLIVITSLGFAFYINNFGQYNKLFGSIGTMMVLMLWIWFNSWNLLIGFELNVSIYSAKRKKESLVGKDLAIEKPPETIKKD